MGGRGTAILVGGLLVLAGVAVADALRADGGDERARTATTGGEPAPTLVAPDPREALASANVEGVLYATVADDAGCELQALTLPELTAVRLLRAPACRFGVSPDGRHVAFGSPCPTDRFFVLELGRDDLSAGAGCSPAWRPDGRLTFVLRGDVIAVERVGCRSRACVATLLPARRLAAELGAYFVDRFTLREIGWFTPTRLAAVVETRRGGRQLLAVLEDGRLVARPRLGGSSYSQLHVLPHRRRAVATGFGDVEVVGADGDGRASDTVDPARAIAYAPDERTYAAVRAGTLCFHRASGARIGCTALVAADVEWR